jgi:glucan phosphoethanolaminetransferase (alkaline phosphatase superfamily)
MRNMKYFNKFSNIISKIKTKILPAILVKKIGVIKEKILSNRFCLWLFVGFLTLICFLLPDILYLLVEETYVLKPGREIFTIFLPMALSMAASYSIVAYILLFLFTIMELIQFGHMAYFGFPINSFAIELVAKSVAEIMEVVLDLIIKAWYLPFLVLIPYILLIKLYRKTSKRRFKHYFAAIILSYYVSLYYCKLEGYAGGEYKGTDLKELGVYMSMPISAKISLENSLRSFSGFLYDRLPKLIKSNDVFVKKEYAEYAVEGNDVDPPINIILIVGESVNNKRMSLFGYERDTTPFLKKISLEDENFVFKEAISSGVLTHTSISFFINIHREPTNVNHMLSRKTDMFMLAKKNGFSTAYLSAHGESLLMSMSVNYVDKIITKEEEGLEKKIKEEGEIYLVHYFRENIKDKLLKTDKNFLIIHQRILHTPYRSAYKVEHDRFSRYITEGISLREFHGNTYDNAMLYNDYVLNELLNAIKEETKGVPTYVFYISDHGETFDKDRGLYGHGFLSEEVFKIPFFATTYWTKDAEFKKELEDLFYPTHYEIAKIVAKKLGYKVINPNEEEGVFYANGVNIYGLAGYFIIKKDPISKRIEFIKSETLND